MLSRKHTNNRRTTKKRAKTIANTHGHKRKERKACRGMGLDMTVLVRKIWQQDRLIPKKYATGSSVVAVVCAAGALALIVQLCDQVLFVFVLV